MKLLHMIRIGDSTKYELILIWKRNSEKFFLIWHISHEIILENRYNHYMAFERTQGHVLNSD